MSSTAYRIETVSRPSRYKKKQKQTQKAEVKEKQTNKKNLKQSAIFANVGPADAEPSSGLGMKGSRLLTRQERWQRKHPEKRRAHELVRRALLRGDLVKGVCEDCGTDQHVDAHHEDYRFPLAVTWLCRRDHMRRHRRPILKTNRGDRQK